MDVIAVGLVCVTVIFVMGMVLSHRQRMKLGSDGCDHHWINVDCQQGYARPVNTLGQMKQTMILQRCAKCGEHDTEMIDGEWTRESLGINDETVKELLAILDEIQPPDNT